MSSVSPRNAVPQTVYLDYTGCRLNEAEIEQMAREFCARGNIITRDISQADLIIINTCAVTNEAARKTRKQIFQAGRANSQAQIVTTGCYAHLEPGALAALPGVSRVIDNLDKERLVAIVSEGSERPEYEQEPIQRHGSLAPGTLGRTRAFVKVQDGCDNACTFCITTLARGAGRSRPERDVLTEIETLLQTGYKEIVLTGVHLASYGHDRGLNGGLQLLVQAILRHTPPPRLRLSSLEPWDLHPEFFDLWEDGRLCPHVHLPLQSGCDSTLRRMARRTSQASFTALADAARKRISGLSLTTDLIVGFPGETETEYEETVSFVLSIGFSRLHVFPYSMRPGTAAARMRHQVPDEVKSSRKKRLLDISDELWQRFQRAHLGKEATVLWESARGSTPDGFVWQGYTASYLRVGTTSPLSLFNTITPVQITALEDGQLHAKLAADVANVPLSDSADPPF